MDRAKAEKQKDQQDGREWTVRVIVARAYDLPPCDTAFRDAKFVGMVRAREGMVGGIEEKSCSYNRKPRTKYCFA